MSSQSLDWESFFPSPVDVREIKQMLLSGNQNEIWRSFERIKSYMNDDRSVMELIKCDIPEYLCDVFTPNNNALAKMVYSCLEVMAKHSEFYTHSHLSFVIESLIRSLYFLLKSSEESSSLSECINLLIIIFEGYNKYSAVPETKTIHNFIQLLVVLVKVPLVHRLQVGKLILGLLDTNSVGWDSEAFEKVSGLICGWFDSVEDMLKSVGSVKDNIIMLGCMISNSSLRCVISNDKNFEECRVQKESDVERILVTRICYFLVESAAGYFEDSPLGAIEHDPSRVLYFYQALLYLYSEDIKVNKIHLSHGLSETGFLQFTTKVLSLAHSNENLRKICISVLFAVILFLSEDAFQFPEVWPLGRSDFQGQILRGMSLLPLNSSFWMEVLSDSRSDLSCKLALLLYLYFYAMTAKSQPDLENIYSGMASFMCDTIGIESSVFLVKVVWFVHVISTLSKYSSCPVNFKNEATKRMVSLLESQPDLSLVYTHHPALLYWVFSYKINAVIQSKTVHLWLQNKTSDCKELEGLIGKSPDARFAILSVMQTGSGYVLESAFLCLKSHLTEFQDEDLACNIWFLLPQILAKYTTDPASASNADFMIELSSLRLPSSLDATKLIRIASLLPEVLVKSNLLSVVPLLSLIHQLIELGFRSKDSRVLNVFFRSNGFVTKILEGVNANITDIALYNLKILTILWRNEREIQIPQGQPKFVINKETILKVLESSCIGVLSASLDFVNEILHRKFQSQSFSIKDIDSDFLEVLFIQIQNICIKDLPETNSKCWVCLKSILVVNNEDSYELASNPLLHELIIFHLLRLDKSTEMKEFVTEWVSQNNKILKDDCFSRKIFGAYFAETFHAVYNR